MDAFYEITWGYEITLCKTQASWIFCVVYSAVLNILTTVQNAQVQKADVKIEN